MPRTKQRLISYDTISSTDPVNTLLISNPIYLVKSPGSDGAMDNAAGASTSSADSSTLPPSFCRSIFSLKKSSFSFRGRKRSNESGVSPTTSICSTLSGHQASVSIGPADNVVVQAPLRRTSRVSECCLVTQCSKRRRSSSAPEPGAWPQKTVTVEFFTDPFKDRCEILGDQELIAGAHTVSLWRRILGAIRDFLCNPFLTNLFPRASVAKQPRPEHLEPQLDPTCSSGPSRAYEDEPSPLSLPAPRHHGLFTESTLLARPATNTRSRCHSTHSKR